MSEQALKPEQWDARWNEDNTPWDMGGVTPGLLAWVRENSVKDTKVLVPGCGRGHDAVYMAKDGAQVTAVDYSSSALAAAKAAYPDSPVDWQQADVTALPFHDQFDLIWEYTCFCALQPHQRETYLDQVAQALKPGGRFIGITFLRVDKPEGPPFAIEPEALRDMLTARFEVNEFEAPTNRSVKPRSGKEIWFACSLTQ